MQPDCSFLIHVFEAKIIISIHFTKKFRQQSIWNIILVFENRAGNILFALYSCFFDIIMLFFNFPKSSLTLQHRQNCHSISLLLSFRWKWKLDPFFRLFEKSISSIFTEEKTNSSQTFNDSVPSEIYLCSYILYLFSQNLNKSFFLKISTYTDYVRFFLYLYRNKFPKN